ncbi:MAG: hypothetical protein ACOC36_00410 [Fibrobacterota bacterium]
MKYLCFLFSALLIAGCASTGKKTPRYWDTYGIRAYRYFLSGDLAKSVQLYKRGFLRARRADDVHRAAHYLFNTGRAFYELGTMDSAVSYLTRSYEEMLFYKDSVSASRAAAMLALCEAGRGDEAQSSSWFRKTEPLRGEDCEHYYSFIKAKSSWILSRRIENPQALEEAQAYYSKKKEFGSLSQIYYLKAENTRASGDCGASREYLENALDALDRTQERFRRYRVLLALASVQFCSGQEEAGRRCYNRAVDCAPLGIELPSMNQVSSCAGSCR